MVDQDMVDQDMVDQDMVDQDMVDQDMVGTNTTPASKIFYDELFNAIGIPASDDSGDG